MKTSLVFFAITGLGAAQSITDAMPECAVECLEEAVSNATDCSIDDGDCICEVDNYRNTYSVSQACVLQACGAAKAVDEILPAAASYCSVVTGGATAPPVGEEDTPSETTTSSSSAPSENSDSEEDATPSSITTDSAEAASTDEPSGASPALRGIGSLGSLIMGLLVAF